MSNTGAHTIDRDRVASAIRDAEARTSGEIYCVLARTSDGYFLAAAFAVAFAMLLASLLAGFALEAWWVSIRIPSFVAAQILAYGAALLLLQAFPALRIWLVPKRVRYAKAHDNARKQFLARNVHLTAGRTGVLIFVSLAERYGEVLADSGIDKKVPQATWNAAVAQLTQDAGAGRLTEAYLTAIGTVGGLLAEHFPRGPRDRNELDDHLVEI
ncbi:MAG: TPM domain-containing protein [Mesorhizobium sp.]|nr:TPM domain-containing protein [Mesorhizobium sp.]